MNCCAVRPYLQAYVDKELSPERSIDVEQHLASCEQCAEEVEFTYSLCCATRNSVSEVAMCASFRSRLSECVTEERKRQERTVHNRPLSWRVIAPLAAAAALTLFFSAGQPVNSSVDESWKGVAASAQVAPDNLVDLLVRHHAKNEEPEMMEPSSVERLEPHLGFRVRAPNLDRYGARFEGAALVPVNHSRAAVLRYNLGGRRVTLYMYDPEKLPLRAQRALQPKVVGDRAVFVGNRKGYSIATCERHGVGYAVAGELTGEESAELVAAVYR